MHPARTVMAAALTTALLSSGGDPATGAQRRGAPAFVYVALGDSTGTGYGAREGYAARLSARLAPLRAGTRLDNLSQNGATTASALAAQVPRVAPGAGLVTIGLGLNDVAHGVSPDAFARDLDAMLKRVRARTPAPVVLANLPDISLAPAVPSAWRAALQQRVDAFNAALAEVARRHGVPVADVGSVSRRLRPGQAGLFASDGYHPGDRAHELWAEAMWPHVQAVLGGS